MKRIIFILLALLIFPVGTIQAEQKNYKRSVEQYEIPDVTLVNQDGKKIRLKNLLESNELVIVDFIYGTCTTICPVLSASFSNLQKRLGPDSKKVRLVSITIDPENDTPRILKEYLNRYRARPGWDFLTGSRRDIDRVMNAFNSYFRDKMDHKPLNFIRDPKNGSWVRIYGLLSSQDFIKECQKVGIL